MLRSKCFVTILLSSFLIIVESCTNTGSNNTGSVQGIPLIGNRLDYVKISYNIYSDVLSGNINAKAYELFIHNSSSSDLKNCVLTINDEYKSPLKNMIFYYGFWKGGRKYGNNTLSAKATLVFTFSHDISNHCVFLNTNGNRLPNSSLITKIKIECKNGSGEWKFELNSKD